MPMVIPLALGMGLAMGLLLLPIAIWAARTGVKNFQLYGPILWVLLATFAVVEFSRIGHPLRWMLLLSVVGLFIIGLIPNRDETGGPDAPG